MNCMKTHGMASCSEAPSCQTTCQLLFFSRHWLCLLYTSIGGLTVSTVRTLILVPVLYCSFAGTGIKRNRKKMKASRELNDYYQGSRTLNKIH